MMQGHGSIWYTILIEMTDYMAVASKTSTASPAAPFGLLLVDRVAGCATTAATLARSRG